MHTQNQPRDRQASHCHCTAPRQGNQLGIWSNGRQSTSFSSIAMTNIIPFILILHYALYKFYWLELLIIYLLRNSWLETNITFAINMLLSVKDSGCQKDNAVNDRVNETCFFTILILLTLIWLGIFISNSHAPW